MTYFLLSMVCDGYLKSVQRKRINCGVCSVVINVICVKWFDLFNIDAISSNPPRPRQGGQGVDPRDQAGPPGEGWQDQEPGGDLPLLAAHQSILSDESVIENS